LQVPISCVSWSFGHLDSLTHRWADEASGLLLATAWLAARRGGPQSCVGGLVRSSVTDMSLASAINLSFNWFLPQLQLTGRPWLPPLGLLSAHPVFSALCLAKGRRAGAAGPGDCGVSAGLQGRYGRSCADADLGDGLLYLLCHLGTPAANPWQAPFWVFFRFQQSGALHLRAVRPRRALVLLSAFGACCCCALVVLLAPAVASGLLAAGLWRNTRASSWPRSAWSVPVVLLFFSAAATNGWLTSCRWPCRALADQPVLDPLARSRQGPLA